MCFLLQKGQKILLPFSKTTKNLLLLPLHFLSSDQPTKKLLPQYLAWFLNSHTTQTLLKGQAIGTSIPSISKQVLENLEIAVPGIKIQKAILQITKLRNKEKSLKLEIETLREKQIQQQIINAIK
jgi:restriction endonuclease S subunit